MKGEKRRGGDGLAVSSAESFFGLGHVYWQDGTHEFEVVGEEATENGFWLVARQGVSACAMRVDV